MSVFDCPRTDFNPETSQRRAFDSLVAGECMGEPHADERHYMDVVAVPRRGGYRTFARHATRY